MDPASLATGSGVGGLVVAVVYAGKLIVDWRTDARSGGLAEKSSTITDASTANAIALATLQAVQADNTALRADLADARQELEAKDAKITELEGRLSEAQAQLQGIADELSQLRTTPH